MEERTQGLEEGGGGGAKDLGVRDEVFKGRISRRRRKERKREKGGGVGIEIRKGRAASHVLI